MFEFTFKSVFTSKPELVGDLEKLLHEVKQAVTGEYCERDILFLKNKLKRSMLRVNGGSVKHDIGISRPTKEDV